MVQSLDHLKEIHWDNLQQLNWQLNYNINWLNVC